MAEKKKDNMDLWNRVCTTDPDLTKHINQRGGFTAICAQYQLRIATEQFGPYGADWGIRDIQWDYIGTEEKPSEILLTGEFYYPGGSFSMTVDRMYKAGDEQRKKMLTDFRSKCLSTLGFNSDVFEGRFDDHAYVNELKREKAAEKKTVVKDKQAKQPINAEPPPEEEPNPKAPATPGQRKEIGKLVRALNPDLNKEQLGVKIREMLKASQYIPDELTFQQAGYFIQMVRVMVKKAGGK